MKKDDLCDAFGQIKDSYIIEADTIRQQHTKVSYYLHQFKLAFMIPFTICVFIIIQGILVKPNLPILQYTTQDPGGFGIATIYAKDITDITQENPWSSSMKIKKLPVYQNYVTYGEHEPSKKRKQQMLEEVTYYQTLFSNLDIIENTDTYITAENKQVEIRVDETLTTLIDFKEAVALPEQYAFYNHASKEELYDAGTYLSQHYQNLLRMDHPVVVAKEGLQIQNQETFELVNYELFVYEKADTIEENMVNYGTYRAHFYCDEKHQLDFIRIEHMDKETYVEDYPIMDVKQAKDLFLKQHPSIKEDDIIEVELLYENSINQPYVLPYYKFYVDQKKESLLMIDIPDEIYQMKTYSIPAIQQEYMEEIGG